MTTGKIHALALSVSSSPASNKIWELISQKKPEEINQEIVRSGSASTQGFISVKYSKNPLTAASEILSECEKKRIRIITYWDNDYPDILREINKPPIVLYSKGSLSAGKTIAVVGTRNSGEKSSAITRRLSGELTEAGYTIVSGMAIGIDREAHLGALALNGPTIGVLANGIDIVYPAFNRDLYTKILSSGKSCLISEYPPGILAGKWTFVRRNRIISGLSMGVVIVKAAAKSGALITANHAIDQNREVFACPGLPFDKAYAGCHELIRNGAVLVSCTDDILNELSGFGHKRYNVSPVKRALNTVSRNKPENNSAIVRNEVNYPEDSIERKILELLSGGESDIDTIVRSLDTSTNAVNETLIMLELSNEIMRDGNVVCRV